jgi:TorA maturation chaperone TorD
VWRGMEMREGGLDEAIRAAGGVGALARALGISQPSVSNWNRIPAERVLAVEALTGVPRQVLRPDLYPDGEAPTEVDEVDLLRSHEYGMLALLLGRAPTGDVLQRLSQLKGDPTPLGLAHIALAEAAAGADPDAVQQEYFDLFIGVGRGELLPYASYYLTGFLQDRPLVRLRDDIARLGVTRAEGNREPEDHLAILCEIMSGITAGQYDTEPGTDEIFFERHFKPWAQRFFADLEAAKAARFYRPVGTIGRIFMQIEAEAFAMGA